MVIVIIYCIELVLLCIAPSLSFCAIIVVNKDEYI